MMWRSLRPWGVADHRLGNMCPDDLKKSIYTVFEDRHIRLTPSDLERYLCKTHPGLSRKAVRSAIKEMVTEGALLYTNHFNTTHLELNFCRPLRVSPRIVLSPNGLACETEKDEIHPIWMVQGSAFGVGDHPTTRLALRAVDRVTAQACGLQRAIQALDIGTGSGVLAIAAGKLGAEKVVALDIDPLALHEAQTNIRLNALDQKIALSADALENLFGNLFDLIMANLRPPTLREILPKVEALSSENCHWILSGFRGESVKEVAQLLPQQRTEILNVEEICGWAAMTVRYSSSSHEPYGDVKVMLEE
jgi:ribosomal protein L11 methyltransferase